MVRKFPSANDVNIVPRTSTSELRPANSVFTLTWQGVCIRICPEYIMPQNLLIIGATGLIGKYITKETIKVKASCGRIAVLTSEKTTHEKSSEIDELKHSGIEVLVGDITKEEEVKRAYEGPPLCLFSNPVTHIC